MSIPQLSIQARIISSKLLTYDDIGYTYDHQNSQYDSKESSVITCNIALRSRISGKSLTTFTSKALIQNNLTTFTMKSRMSQKQGYPIPDSYNPQIAVFTETALYVKGSIKDRVLGLTTFRMKSSIKPQRTTSVSFMAFISNGQSIHMRAYIAAWRNYVQLTCSYDARSLCKKGLRMVFYTRDVYQVRSLTAQARIIRTSKKRFTVHFIVPMTEPITINTPKLNFVHLLSAKAFIGRPL